MKHSLACYTFHPINYCAYDRLSEYDKVKTFPSRSMYSFI